MARRKSQHRVKHKGQRGSSDKQVPDYKKHLVAFFSPAFKNLCRIEDVFDHRAVVWQKEYRRPTSFANSFPSWSRTALHPVSAVESTG